jgi:hypothetical protein
MTDTHDDNGSRRRLMHRRSIECTGYLRNDGLWEVEARLVDTKPFAQRDRFRGELQPNDPVMTSACGSQSMIPLPFAKRRL